MICPESRAQVLPRLVELLVAGAAGVDGDPLLGPNLQRDKIGVDLAVAQDQHIDGILRLRQITAGPGVVEARRLRIVLGLKQEIQSVLDKFQ